MLDEYGRGVTSPLGSYDDGTSNGAIRATLSLGELVKLPFRDGYFAGEAGASGYNHLVTGGQYALANSDGSGTYLDVAVNDFAANGGNGIWLPFYGRRFGLRTIAVNSTLYNPGISVWIDGFCYDLRQHLDAETDIVGAIPNRIERMWMCPDELSDIKHIARIRVPAAPNAIGTTHSYLAGVIVERRPGHQDPVPGRSTIEIATGTVPNVAGPIPITGILGAASLYARRVERVDYFNTDGSDHTVTISAGGNIIWTSVVAANSNHDSNTLAPASWMPGPDFRMNGGEDSTYSSYYEHATDATGVINFHVVGGA